MQLAISKAVKAKRTIQTQPGIIRGALLNPYLVFISYSRNDKVWLERLQRHLKPLDRQKIIRCWDDTRIPIGAKWKDEIQGALDSANFAVLLISADFLASDFIVDNELPPLLASAEDRGTIILPVIIGSCDFSGTPSLSQFQAVNDPAQPLNKMMEGDWEHVLSKVAETIKNACALMKSDCQEEQGNAGDNVNEP